MQCKWTAIFSRLPAYLLTHSISRCRAECNLCFVHEKTMRSRDEENRRGRWSTPHDYSYVQIWEDLVSGYSCS